MYFKYILQIYELLPLFYFSGENEKGLDSEIIVIYQKQFILASIYQIIITVKPRISPRGLILQSCIWGRGLIRGGWLIYKY